MTPTLSIIIPTPGRASLKRTLDSIAGQMLHAGDEVIVVGDIHSRLLPEIVELVRSLGPQYHYIGYNAGRHAWGHPQINEGMRLSRGDYVVFQDDDDIFAPLAFDAIRIAIARQEAPRPLLFRFASYQGPVYWRQRGLVAQGHIGGHCLVAPNDPTRLGVWTDRYEGDFDAIVATLATYDGQADWETPIIAIARPRLTWRAVTTPADVGTLRHLRNAGRDTLSRNQEYISPVVQMAWWDNHDPKRLRAYLFTNADGLDVGAGLLSLREDGRWWITILVAPEHRSRGYGTLIYRLLAMAPPADVYAEILADNVPSIRATVRAGYRWIDAGEQTVTYVARQGAL